MKRAAAASMFRAFRALSKSASHLVTAVSVAETSTVRSVMVSVIEPSKWWVVGGSALSPNRPSMSRARRLKDRFRNPVDWWDWRVRISRGGPLNEVARDVELRETTPILPAFLRISIGGCGHAEVPDTTASDRGGRRFDGFGTDNGVCINSHRIYIWSGDRDSRRLRSQRLRRFSEHLRRCRQWHHQRGLVGLGVSHGTLDPWRRGHDFRWPLPGKRPGGVEIRRGFWHLRWRLHQSGH